MSPLAAAAKALLRPRWWWLDAAAVAITATGSGGAVWLAAAVPPQGLNCRTVVKLVMLAVYVAKYLLQLLVNRLWRGNDGAAAAAAASPSSWKYPSYSRMLVSALLDFCSVAVFATIIFTTQIGILNRPGCYWQCLSPESPDSCAIYPPSASWESAVQPRLRGLYPGILFGFLGGQLAICIVIIVVFWSARGVYLQDDRPIPS